jgi:hypothetical protein
MITSRNLSLALLLAASAAGCAASAPGNPDPGTGSGSGSGSGSDDAPVPLTPVGKFNLQSDYDIASNMPGTVGTAVNAFIDATDSPDDPTRYIVDKLIAQLPNGAIKSAVQSAAPLVTGYLNDRLLDVAPDFVTKVKDIGQKFGDVAKHFGTMETLVVTKTGATFTGVHTITGVHFTIDTVAMDFPFADYNLPNVTANGVKVDLSTAGKLTLAAHDMPMSYGQVLRLALDEAIIPMVDPGANGLADVLHNAVNCTNVGQYVYDQVGIGSPSTFEVACNSGLDAAAGFIYQQIDGINSSALDFGIAGTARGVDTNHDGKMDTIQRGAWSGTLSYSGTPAPLSTATFIGSAM